MVTELERLTAVKTSKPAAPTSTRVIAANHSERFRIWVTGQARCVAALAP